MLKPFRLTLAIAAILSPSLVFAGSEIETVYPSSGDGISQTFAVQVTDSGGYSNIQWIYLRFEGPGYLSSPVCWIGVNVGDGNGTAGTIWLNYDNYVSGWSSAPVPNTGGPSVQLSNSQCSFLANQVTLTPNGNSETVTIPLTFTSSFAGSKSVDVYSIAKDGTHYYPSNSTTWTVDPNGGTPDFQIAAAPANQQLGAGGSTSYISVTSLNGFTGQVSCSVTGLPSSVTADPNCGSFQTASTAQSTYTITTSAGTPVGTYVVTFTGTSGTLTHSAPVTLDVQAKNVGAGVDPISGSGAAATFVVSAGDTAGYTDLNGIDILINGTFSAANGCWLYQDDNSRLWLANDDASNWTYVTPGSASVIQNSQCWINGTSYSLYASGNLIQPTFTINFQPGFAGAKTIFLQTVEQPGKFDGYQTKGTWTVTSGGSGQPFTTSVSPSSGNGSTATFTLTATDSAGYMNLNGVDMLINASYNNVNACWLYLDENKQLWLANDDISNWTYVTVGSSSVIQNSQCSISGTSFTASESGNTLTGTFTVGFTPAFLGAKTIYLQSVDAAGNQRGYTTQGTWTVQ